MLRPLLHIATAATCLAACTHAPETASTGPMSTEVARQGIAASNAEFARAIKAKDIPALTHLFTEDGVFVSPAGGFVKGWTALEPHWTERLAKATFVDGGITTESLDVRGDLAVETARFTWTIQRGDAAPVQRTGRALTVWHHDPDGRWRMLADHPEYDPLK